MALEVLKPGLLTTVQDLGRTGHQVSGVSASGAMDALSHRLANIACGNDVNAPTLECTLTGPRLQFRKTAWLCLAGGDLGAVVMRGGRGDIAPIKAPLDRPFEIGTGDVLDFRRRRTGARCYIAVAGGFDVPPVLGSRATHTRTEMGGVQGRALQAGDLLQWGEPHSPPDAMRPIPPKFRFAPATGVRVIRYTRGREFDSFTKQALKRFDSETFTLTKEADRMGYRLEGPELARSAGLGDMLSESVTFGTVQVPPSGQPMVLMADRQTTGGYPRIAQVVKVDLPLLAQMLPGEQMRFQRVGLEEAQKMLVEQERALAAL
jgi:biotin-dependent carboxylase-like uncharacterized protein